MEEARAQLEQLEQDVLRLEKEIHVTKHLMLSENFWDEKLDFMIEHGIPESDPVLRLARREEAAERERYFEIKTRRARLFEEVEAKLDQSQLIKERMRRLARDDFEARMRDNFYFYRHSPSSSEGRRSHRSYSRARDYDYDYPDQDRFHTDSSNSSHHDPSSSDGRRSYRSHSRDYDDYPDQSRFHPESSFRRGRSGHEKHRRARSRSRSSHRDHGHKSSPQRDSHGKKRRQHGHHDDRSGQRENESSSQSAPPRSSDATYRTQVEAWYTFTLTALSQEGRTKLTSFPCPPAAPCTNRSCSAKDKLASGVCECAVKSAFSTASISGGFKKESIRWHPDKFSCCPAAHREEMKRKATLIFKVIKSME